MHLSRGSYLTVVGEVTTGTSAQYQFPRPNRHQFSEHNRDQPPLPNNRGQCPYPDRDESA